ncbi:hypothetical protein LCGC14_0355520 [marine sediment metagenome]|uniref:Uncharacterized protein n=1 Tax=marine sediment metagenome TaxID=412755 RepID=A0A0F9TSQ5_9ZZZZ
MADIITSLVALVIICLVFYAMLTPWDTKED